jgi:cell division protein FtsZ
VAPVEQPVAADPAPAEVAAQAASVESDSDELLLGSETILTPPPASNPLPNQGNDVDAGQPGRRWLNTGAEAGEPARTSRASTATRDSGGTLFERMSSIARGAAKAQVDEERPSERRDSLDLPGFLNRQNNQ